MLTNTTVFSVDKTLSAKAPIGWFSAVENESNSTDLWLVENDFNASMSLFKINLDQKTNTKVQVEGRKIVIDLIKTIKKAENNSKIIYLNGITDFSIYGRDYSSFMYKDQDENFVRTVVFFHGSHFYDFSLVIKKSTISQDLLQNYFDKQDAVLFSLK